MEEGYEEGAVVRATDAKAEGDSQRSLTLSDLCAGNSNNNRIQHEDTSLTSIDKEIEPNRNEGVTVLNENTRNDVSMSSVTTSDSLNLNQSQRRIFESKIDNLDSCTTPALLDSDLNCSFGNSFNVAKPRDMMIQSTSSSSIAKNTSSEPHRRFREDVVNANNYPSSGVYYIKSGRGSGSKNHPGNIKYRKKVDENKDLHHSEILKSIKEDGGTFVEPEDYKQKWYREISDVDAMKKIAQRCRDS